MTIRAEMANTFWSFVEILGPDECWLWNGSQCNTGYGRIRFKKQSHSAHRLAYTFTHGEIPMGEGYHGTCVCHACDVKLCCNPKHLFLGTHGDNIADKVRKNRQRGGQQPGENNPRAKLTEQDVREIRGSCCKNSDLANSYGIHYETIVKIRMGRSWKHIAREALEDKP